MGIYFIAAGTSSKNRQKTLDKAHTFDEISPFLLSRERDELRKFFNSNESIYAWGANKKNINDLINIRTGEYVVDVKNKIIVQVFKYCFFFETHNSRLQEFFGWDKEKPLAERRPYHYVYFLKEPTPTRRNEKKFFQIAFNFTSNPQWLIGQRYFGDSEVLDALSRTSCNSTEELLGLINIEQDTPANGISTQPPKSPSIVIRKPPISKFEVPSWLKDIVGKVKALKNDPGHLERDHEDLVASLFELLGYERIHDIKFRRGNIDIRIEKNNKPIITVEVKADWALSPESRNALSQAYNYALETGTPFVIITNGDRFCVYDRRHGMSYEDNLIADFTLTNLTKENVSCLNLLKKEVIK